MLIMRLYSTLFRARPITIRNLPPFWAKLHSLLDITLCRYSRLRCSNTFLSRASSCFVCHANCMSRQIRGTLAGQINIRAPMKTSMCTETKSRVCWNCQKEIGAEIFFCEICKIIQPPLAEMSFFQILASSETFDVDIKNMTKRYRELQAMIHPDRFGNSKDEEQQYSAEQSSLMNKAYNTLLDPLSRAVYLLSLKSITIGEENTMEGTDFLMEVMEINEKLSEVKTVEDLDEICKMNNESIENCIHNLSTSFHNDDFMAAKEWIIKLRYYRNILAIIKEKTMELDQ